MNLCAGLARAVLCSAIILPFCLFPSGVSAGVRLKIWPTSLEVAVAEGEADARTVNVQNEGDELIELRVYALDYSVDTNGAYHFSEAGPDPYSCAAWLNVDASAFSLTPGETRAITVVIQVPEQVEPGEHHAAIFFEQSGGTNNGTGISIGARLACLFYIRVPGAAATDILTSAEIARLILPGWTDGRPVEVSAIVRNTGNAHLTVAARACFTDFRGSRVGEIDLGQVVILPRSDRIMEAAWENPPLFGRVTAKVVIGYRDHQGELVNKEACANFHIIPWKLIMAVALPLIAIGIAAYMGARKFRFRLSLERRGDK